MKEYKFKMWMIRKTAAFLTILAMVHTTCGIITNFITNGKYNFTKNQEKIIDDFSEALNEEDLDRMYADVKKVEKEYNKSNNKKKKNKEKIAVLEAEYLALNEVAYKMTVSKMKDGSITINEILPWDWIKYLDSEELEDPSVNSLDEALNSLEQLSLDDSIYVDMYEALNNLEKTYEEKNDKQNTSVGDKIKREAEEFYNRIYIGQDESSRYYIEGPTSEENITTQNIEEQR